MRRLGNKCVAFLLLLATPAVAKELNLSSFKDANIVWLGSTSGVLEPLAEEIVIATAVTGEIEFFKKDGEQVQAREVWALMDRDQLEQKEKEFELAKKELTYDVNDLEEKYKSEEKKHRDLVEKLEEEIRELTLSKRLPEVSELGDEIEDAITAYKKEIAEAHRKFALNFNAEKLDFEKEKLRHALNKKRLELDAFRDEKRFETSINGRLEYLLPKVRFLPGSETKAKLKGGDQIALIRDDRLMLVVLPEASFPVALDKSKSYLARVSAESGAAYTAHYYDKVSRQEGGKLINFHRFRIRDADLDAARSGSGQKVIINISEQYNQRVYVVPKADLLEHNAHLVQEKGWKGAALTLWPGHEVLSEGTGSLAIAKQPVAGETNKTDEN
jgi:hypothetical protein